MAASTLAAALVEAQSHAQAVAKDSTNSFHRYKYASAEAVIEEARQALAAAGLALITTGWRFEPHASEEFSSAPIGRVHVKYRLLHTSGESVEFESSTPVISEKGRPADKAEATALTYNLGYFLRGLLLLPRVDESEVVDARDDRQYTPGVRSTKAPPQNAPTEMSALAQTLAQELREATTPERRTEVGKSIAEAFKAGRITAEERTRLVGVYKALPNAPGASGAVA